MKSLSDINHYATNAPVPVGFAKTTRAFLLRCRMASGAHFAKVLAIRATVAIRVILLGLSQVVRLSARGRPPPVTYPPLER